MNKKQAQYCMNEWSRNKIPFYFLIDFEMEKIQLHKLEQWPNDVLIDFPSYNINNSSLSETKDLEFDIWPYPKTQYKKAFDEVMHQLKYGNSFLLNLTTTSVVRSNQTLEQLFFYSKAKYKLCHKDNFLFFSPETFVKIKDGYIYSYPMKGTIDATVPNATDKILADKKERAEHNTIVDLIRNDLSIVAKNVHVPKFRFIDRIENIKGPILQVSSEIKGRVKEEYESALGDLIFQLLPAGSISGAPKPKTVEIIQNVEEGKRGYYTGVCGLFDGQNLDSCVVIRYIEKRNNVLYYRSGGGITHMSDVDAEYLETIQKIYVPTY